MARKITGRVEVRVNGEKLLTKTGAKALGIGGYERTPVVGEEYHGYVETASPASVQFSITDTNEKNLLSLADLTDATVYFEAAGGGKAYTLAHAVCKSNLELTAGEGEVPVEFFGPKWEEMAF